MHYQCGRNVEENQVYVKEKLKANKAIQKQMANQYKKYSSYKDSGVEWLGMVPEHWELIPNKYIFNLKKNLVGKKSSQYTLLSLTLNGIIKRDMDNPQGKFPAEFDTYQEVKKDDFVFCLFDVEETPRCIGLSGFEGMITGAYTVYEVDFNFNKRFLYYFYLNLDNNKRLKPLYTGLRNTISKDNFFAFKTFVPPIHEQIAIANYLDQKTAQIDRAIELKEQTIALLKERKQIVIQELVIGKWKINNGELEIRDKSELKDSGVEWIGEVPKEWEVKRLKYTHAMINVKVLSSSSELKYIGMENVESGTGKLVETDSKAEGLASMFQKGDILFGKLRPYLAKVHLAETNGICSTEFIVLRNPNNSYFKNLFISSLFISIVDASTYGAKMPRASIEFIANMELPIPPFVDQQIIVHHIEQESTKIDRAISLQEQEIEKLKELKATLIDSAVTGKIKV